MSTLCGYLGSFIFKGITFIPPTVNRGRVSKTHWGVSILGFFAPRLSDEWPDALP